jgi:hypothetical protein
MSAPVATGRSCHDRPVAGDQASYAIEACAVQRSPVGLVALATNRPEPAVTNRASNEPLGARVTRTRLAT